MNVFESEWESPEYETLAALAGELVFRLPGCTDVMIRKTIASVYRDFCKRTCVLRTVQRIELEHCTRHYPLGATLRDCVIEAVTAVEIEGRRLESTDYACPGFDCISVSPRFLPPEGENTLGMKVTCLEVPTIGSESAPKLFIQRYGDALVNGAYWQLASMTGRAWSDPVQAVMASRAYENALTETRSRYYAGGSLSSGKLNFIKKGTIL